MEKVFAFYDVMLVFYFVVLRQEILRTRACCFLRSFFKCCEILCFNVVWSYCQCLWVVCEYGCWFKQDVDEWIVMADHGPLALWRGRPFHVHPWRREQGSRKLGRFYLIIQEVEEEKKAWFFVRWLLEKRDSYGNWMYLIPSDSWHRRSWQPPPNSMSRCALLVRRLKWIPNSQSSVSTMFRSRWS